MSEETELVNSIRARIEKRCDEYGLDSDGLLRYVLNGIPMGDFGNAIVENDFIRAACYADDNNKWKLFEWACVMYNDVPMDAKGSRKNVAAWCQHGGLRGLMAKSDPDPDPVIV